MYYLWLFLNNCLNSQKSIFFIIYGYLEYYLWLDISTIGLNDHKSILCIIYGYLIRIFGGVVIASKLPRPSADAAGRERVNLDSLDKFAVAQHVFHPQERFHASTLIK